MKIILLTLLVACGSAPTQPQMSQMRSKPAELVDAPTDTNQIGSSKLAGVHTKVLYGDPTKAGYYAILLYVPANTTIQAHSHRDNRVATVVSGTWRFGYGDKFDETKLEVLPPGSVYTEPGTAAQPHFAQTREEAVIVELSGFGPTDTHYVNAADDPSHGG
ncbi:MAG: cupin domain-containing protein [Kofleriaceae bacterium]